MADTPASPSPADGTASSTSTSVADAPLPSSPSTPPLPSSDTDARATGRRRSKSFYGKENSIPTPQKTGGIERKNTAVDLQSIILRATLKQNIAKEIDALKQSGTYEVLEDPGDLDIFEEQASEVLKKKAEEIKALKDTPDGKALLRHTLLLQKCFEKKEENKDWFDEGEFHVKCLVDDLLFNFLVDPPGNTRG